MQLVLSPDRVVVTVMPWSPLLSAQAEALLCWLAGAPLDAAGILAPTGQDFSLGGPLLLAPATPIEAMMVTQLIERAVARWLG